MRHLPYPQVGPSSLAGKGERCMSLPDQHSDRPTRQQIERLVREEQRLLAQHTVADSDYFRIKEIHVALERCWDALRQRRAPVAGTLLGAAS